MSVCVVGGNGPKQNYFVADLPAELLQIVEPQKKENNDNKQYIQLFKIDRKTHSIELVAWQIN